jgi:hypothetical protein
MSVQHFECSEDGMERVGSWGWWVSSEYYDDLLQQKEELQKRYDAIVNKIGDLYREA